MTSLRKTAIVTLASLSVVSGGAVAPAFAGPSRPSVDTSRLDAAPAEYTQYRGYYRGYRGGWRGSNRGAAIAAGVGLGILGAAAVAASRPAYADPYYYDDGYYYESAPVYAPAPVYVAPRGYYAPRYSGYYGPRYRSYDFRDHR